MQWLSLKLHAPEDLHSPHAVHTVGALSSLKPWRWQPCVDSKARRGFSLFVGAGKCNVVQVVFTLPLTATTQPTSCCRRSLDMNHGGVIPPHQAPGTMMTPTHDVRRTCQQVCGAGFPVRASAKTQRSTHLSRLRLYPSSKQHMPAVAGRQSLGESNAYSRCKIQTGGIYTCSGVGLCAT